MKNVVKMFAIPKFWALRRLLMLRQLRRRSRAPSGRANNLEWTLASSVCSGPWDRCRQIGISKFASKLELDFGLVLNCWLNFERELANLALTLARRCGFSGRDNTRALSSPFLFGPRLHQFASNFAQAVFGLGRYFAKCVQRRARTI